MKPEGALAAAPRAFWPSLAVYVAVTAWHGRDILRTLFSHIASDTGDPLLNATVLSWSAQHVPFTQQWWNLPIYYPTPHALAFAEHLLGLAPVSTPLYWLTGSGLAAYNLTMLLTFPLAAAAMFALVHGLTGCGAAAFLAGAAYGFAPYRIAHLYHLQVAAAFWAPLALLGLHRFLSTKKWAWLAVFGACWALQGMANGYFLVFLSVLVGLWVAWFVVLQRRWGALPRIATAGLVGALPLAPILLRYISVHRRYELTRSFEETVFFSADLAGVLCAPARLQFWSWLTIGCKLEGELFPGATVPIVCAVALLVLWRPAVALPSRPLPRAVVLSALAVAVVYLGIALSVWWWGRWRLDLGPITATASTFLKPFTTAALAGAVALGLTASFGRIGGTAAAWFYAFAALVTWLLALGPIPMMSERPVFDLAPYSWLMALPGVDSLRVPARFFMMTVLCLAALMGLLVSGVLRITSRPAAMAITGTIALGLFIDGWVARIPAEPAPDMLWADRLSGSTVLELPFQHVETAPGFRAVEGGWRTSNGYSGYAPPSYGVLRAAARAEDGSFLPYLAPAGVLHVIVQKGAPRQVEMVAREAASPPLRETADRLLYRIAQRAPVESTGRRVEIVRATASCAAELVHQAMDGHETTTWDCGGQFSDEEMRLDLGRVAVVGAIRHVLGRNPADHPRTLVVDTSADGTDWNPAWEGGPAGLVFQAAVRHVEYAAFVIPFESRPARYVRLRQTGRDPETHWTMAEIEVYDSVSDSR